MPKVERQQQYLGSPWLPTSCSAQLPPWLVLGGSLAASQLRFSGVRNLPAPAGRRNRKRWRCDITWEPPRPIHTASHAGPHATAEAAPSRSVRPLPPPIGRPTRSPRRCGMVRLGTVGEIEMRRGEPLVSQAGNARCRTGRVRGEGGGAAMIAPTDHDARSTNRPDLLHDDVARTSTGMAPVEGAGGETEIRRRMPRSPRMGEAAKLTLMRSNRQDVDSTAKAAAVCNCAWWIFDRGAILCLLPIFWRMRRRLFAVPW